MKQKTNMRLLLVACMATTAALTACFGGGSGGNTTDIPMPSAEEECVNRIYHILMSDEGRAMSGPQIAALKADKSIFCVGLPVGDTDVLPRMGGAYLNEETGGTIVFSPADAEADTIHPVADATLRIVVHSWEDASCLPDSAYTTQVHNRGNGILTLYSIVHRGCWCSKHDLHPDGYPEYGAPILYVFPGADSLWVSYGYVKSIRSYVWKAEEL